MESRSRVGSAAVRWTEGWARRPPEALTGRAVVGVLPGEGIGPEVTGAACRVLRALESASAQGFDVVTGGPIGREAEGRSGEPLNEEVAASLIWRDEAKSLLVTEPLDCSCWHT